MSATLNIKERTIIGIYQTILLVLTQKLSVFTLDYKLATNITFSKSIKQSEIVRIDINVIFRIFK